ncbi:LexA family transcriptional regulator [Mycobacterium sp. KBS0706]|uniref:LexA family protein n=1 Tax=Mycobacterium sp. KBS0706 TaxID=2578109 RepID=UPI001C8F5653|nr:MarR family transcriptional regulator [Mycobacterium sp. KBS0706]
MADLALDPLSAGMGLTPNQADCMRVIQELMDLSGVCPSYQELADELDLRSKGAIHRLITKLIERGHLRRQPHHSRALEILRRVPMPTIEPTFVLSADLAERRGQ